MDCSVVPLRQKGLFLISTTDFFYPSVDDPYMNGKIGCANVLSDLYSMGVVNCDTILMILAASTDMTKEQQAIVSRQLIEGFNELATEAETSVTGGQTVRNPYPIIGGTATCVCQSDEFILPENAVPGDLIVLTKPLGTQVAVNLSQWRYLPEKWEKVQDIVTKEDAARAYEYAMYSMARLNRTAAKLMHKYGAHGATDVTGFGLLGHGTNLAKNQKAAVNFEIHTLPIIKHMKEVNERVNYNLLKGTSAETSGGILVCLPSDVAEAFCKEIEALDNCPAWIIGRVVTSGEDRTQNTCTILSNPTIIPV